MRVWIRVRIVWMLVVALAATALAQTPVPANPGTRQAAFELAEAKAEDAPSPQNTAGNPAQPNAAQPQNPAAQNKPPATAKKKSGKAKWIVIGVVAGAAAIIGAVFAARLNNEGYFYEQRRLFLSGLHRLTGRS